MNTKAECPACGANVNVGPKPRIGKKFMCPNCRAELEVTWLDPVELDWPYEEDEEEFEDED